MTKITRNSVWCGGLLTAVKKLDNGFYGCVCKCGARYKMKAEQLLAGDSPCDCSETVSSKESTALAAVNNDADRKRKLQERMKRLNSVFKDDVAIIQKLLDDSNSDGAIQRFQKRALSTMVELIPIAEEKYRKFGNERAAYALNSLITQARELVADIKAEEDRRGLALHLSRDIIQPAFISIMQNMVDNVYQLKRGVEDYVPTNRVGDVHRQVEASAREMTHFLEQTYAQLRDKIMNEMTEI